MTEIYEKENSKYLINTKALQLIPEVAVKIGQNEALFLQQVNYWLVSEKNKNYFDGKKWTYDSYLEWQEQFPFWSLSTLKRTIRQLEDWGILITKNKLNTNNKIHYKTKWYSIDYEKFNKIMEGKEKLPQKRKKSMGQNEAKEGVIMTPNSGQNEANLYITKIYTKTLSEISLSKDNIDDSKNESSGLNLKQTLPENKFIAYWNNTGHKPMSKHKNPEADVYKESVKYFDQLKNGTFFVNNKEKFDKAKLENFGINILDFQDRKFSDEEILHAIDNFIKDNTPGYMAYRNTKPKSCREWLLSGTGHSWALVNLTRDPVLTCHVPLAPATLAIYQKNMQVKETDELYPDLVKGVNAMVKRKAEYDKKYGKYVDIPIFKDNKFFSQHLNFLEKKNKNQQRNDILYMYTLNHWKQFSVWLTETYNKGYTLNPSEEMVNQAKIKYEESEQQQTRRKLEEEEIENEKLAFIERQRSRGPNRFQMAAAGG